MWIDAVKSAGEVVGSTGKKKIHGTEGEDGIGGRRDQREVCRKVVGSKWCDYGIFDSLRGDIP
jgi:hypothetical protein